MSWDLSRYTQGALYEHVRKATLRAQATYAGTIDAILARQARGGDSSSDSEGGDSGVATRESFDFQEQPGRVNLLGVRGLDPNQLHPIAKPRELEWDDTMFVAYRDATSGRPCARAFELNTERNFGPLAADHPDGPKDGGKSHLVEGFHRYKFGSHIEATRLALEPYPRVRTFTCDEYPNGAAPKELDVEGPPTWNQNINIHNGGTASTPRGWSDGCQTMRGNHPAVGGEGFPEFIHLVQSDSSIEGAGGSRVLSYPLVRGDDLEPFGGALRWQAPRDPVALSELETHYANNEGGVGGYYPVGWNRVWHGGIHLHGAGDVLAVAEGEVVAARLHSGAAPTPVDGGQTSRCFLLIRHQLQLEIQGNQSYSPYVWSLYYHLQPLEDDESGGLDEPDWVTKLDELEPDQRARLAAGEVIEPGIFVGCGEVIGQSGLLSGAPTLHFEIMSEEPLDLEVFQRAPFELFTSDTDGDGFADDLELLRRLDKRAVSEEEDWPWPWGSESEEEDDEGLPVISEEEAREAAREARGFVVQHQSEWSASDWSKLREHPWELDDAEYDAALEEIERLQFASGLGPKAPQTSRITSYHPLRFLQAIQDEIDAQSPLGEECTPLPEREDASAVEPNEPSEPSGERPLLSRGSQGEWVVFLQEQLNRHGHGLDPDGIFGGLTDAAVRSFQERNGCSVDGIVGNQTWTALDGQSASIS